MYGAAATAAWAAPIGSPARASRLSTASSRAAIPSGVAPWTGTPHRSVMVVLIRPASLAWAVLNEYAGSAGRGATRGGCWWRPAVPFRARLGPAGPGRRRLWWQDRRHGSSAGGQAGADHGWQPGDRPGGRACAGGRGR